MAAGMRLALRIAALLFAASTAAANAGSVTVAPLRVVFAGGASVSGVTVENSGSAEILVQTEVFAWEPSSEGQKLGPTEDVISMPPVFRLAPGARQTVRVGLTRPFTDRDEKAFRLMITEVPVAASPGGAVNVSVRHNLPVFVQASKVAPAALTARHDPSGWRLANAGGQHVQIRRWRLRDGSGAILADAEGPGYLLPGEQRTIAAARTIDGSGSFEADTATGTLKVAIIR